MYSLGEYALAMQEQAGTPGVSQVSLDGAEIAPETALVAIAAPF
jgi:hypothetical protein